MENLTMTTKSLQSVEFLPLAKHLVTFNLIFATYVTYVVLFHFTNEELRPTQRLNRISCWVSNPAFAQL